MRRLRLTSALLIALVAALSSGRPAFAQGPPISVTVDRGNGAIYFEGDPITVCVGLDFSGPNIYMASSFPVRLTNTVGDRPPVVVFEGSVAATGQHCIDTFIAPPLGDETIRAEVFDPLNDFLIASAEVFYTSAPGPGTPGSQSGPVHDYASLVDALRAAGATVTPDGPASASLFSTSAVFILVNGERVQVMEYPDDAAADADAAQISADGSTFRRGAGAIIHVDWVAPPHFYKQGRIIVLYVGSNPDTIAMLDAVLGPQFAGR